MKNKKESARQRSYTDRRSKTEEVLCEPEKTRKEAALRDHGKREEEEERQICVIVKTFGVSGKKFFVNISVEVLVTNLGAVDAKKNLQARAFVFQTLPEDVLLQVAKHKHVKDVWEALRVRYLGAYRVQKARIQTLRSELEMLKMKKSEKIDEFSGKLSAISTKIKSLGSNLEDEVVVRKLLNSVPKKFLQIFASIEQYSEIEHMSLEEAVGRLKAYEDRIKVLDEEENDQGKLLLTKEDWQERSK
ncbi:hypothetical protein E3N88_23653 [Mikania micrantha]|uniref:Zinc finger, CCHC-type n=1 Tax=Mikania micrantha TaxID=192012 RepID=A0A5N6NDY0_9ASTR|nr:hypothetical protein E3N88_23653 [Mikania micrantha]